MYKKYTGQIQSSIFKPAYVVEFTPEEQDEQVMNAFKEIANKCL